MLFKHITFDGKEKNSNVMKNRSESFYSLRPKIIERFLESWKKKPSLEHHISKTNGGTGNKFGGLPVFYCDYDDAKFNSSPVLQL